MCVTCHMKIDAKNIGISIIMLFYICDLYLCLTKLCEFTVVFYWTGRIAGLISVGYLRLMTVRLVAV